MFIGQKGHIGDPKFWNEDLACTQRDIHFSNWLAICITYCANSMHIQENHNFNFERLLNQYQHCIHCTESAGRERLTAVYL